MSHLNIALDRYASIGTVMHYILVISQPHRGLGFSKPKLVRRTETIHENLVFPKSRFIASLRPSYLWKPTALNYSFIRNRQWVFGQLEKEELRVLLCFKPNLTIYSRRRLKTYTSLLSIALKRLKRQAQISWAFNLSWCENGKIYCVDLNQWLKALDRRKARGPAERIDFWTLKR